MRCGVSIEVWANGLLLPEGFAGRVPAPCLGCGQRGWARRARHALGTAAVVRERSDTVPSEPEALRLAKRGLPRATLAQTA